MPARCHVDLRRIIAVNALVTAMAVIANARSLARSSQQDVHHIIHARMKSTFATSHQLSMAMLTTGVSIKTCRAQCIAMRRPSYTATCLPLMIAMVITAMALTSVRLRPRGALALLESTSAKMRWAEMNGAHQLLAQCIALRHSSIATPQLHTIATEIIATARTSVQKSRPDALLTHRASHISTHAPLSRMTNMALRTSGAVTTPAHLHVQMISRSAIHIHLLQETILILR